MWGGEEPKKKKYGLIPSPYRRKKWGAGQGGEDGCIPETNREQQTQAQTRFSAQRSNWEEFTQQD